ncbi:disease resistance protein RPV1-like isoform X2 [Alnus glutinosa]|uniref:disease resistance protein RPV1-like isoform X2 n=1 Tax=Alnus glutinosa TaxID=3517 RepID=UPI002D7A2998|nr:disease resistance protein RPV1-like isoform X2 [Alnus glutinosa]
MAASAFLSSSSSSHPSWTYDVFLSFRGEDTRKSFTDHLYLALRDAGINTFRDDDKLRSGEDIASELLSAIQGSKISVIVFSRNYAESKWCLEELVKIMECRRTVRQLALPIFYDVEPSDVRHQTGTFAKAFLKHEERYSLDKVSTWRTALSEAANLSGWDLRNTADGHEAKFIRKIVEAVSKELNSTYLYVTLHPVGVDSRVQDITSLLGVGANDVRMVGIWGMGGIGKTTISKAIYNQLFHSFEGKSFLANIRETSKQPDGLVRLQKQLLFDILKMNKTKVNNVDTGIVTIQERLCHRKVLVILDDVDQLEQLNAIARSRDWFGPGSRIIITTRDEQLLKAIEVDEVYTTKEMSEIESLELFSWHAFRNSYPSEDYMDLSRSIVAYSGGLPLALEVLGSFIFSRSMQEWESTLEKLKRIPHDQIQKKLRISFDSLSDSTLKDIFLDISCFFIGMDKSYVIQILEACGFFAEIGISVLIQRCLLSVGERNKLIMHDLLRDMGREIVREECPKIPGKCSRLWLHKDALDALEKDEGTEAVEGLTLKFSRLNTVNFGTRAFIKMQRLRLLQLDHVHLSTGDYEHLSKELRWLRWHGFPLKHLPNEFYSRNLVAIDLRYSNLTQVWKNSEQLFEKLKFLNLSHSHYLIRTPNFARLPNLEKLILKDCRSLFEVQQSIGDLNNLVLVNLKDCKSLESLPKSFYRLKSLQILILSGCSKIGNLADDLGQMESLTTFLADNTAIRQVPPTIIQLKNLKYLSLCGCKGSPSKSLASLLWPWMSPRKSPKSVMNLLPASLRGLNSLRDLRLRDCNLSDDAIPKDLGSLCSLEFLDLKNNHFRSLPSSLGGLSKLQTLILSNCTKLQSIPDLPPNLNVMWASDCTALERMPNLSNLSNMEHLWLTNCNKLVEISGLDKLLKSNCEIQMVGCSSLITKNFKQSILKVHSLSLSLSLSLKIRIFFKVLLIYIMLLMVQDCTPSEFSGIFGRCILGSDIPNWYPYKEEGPSVSFEVPRIIEGITLCFVYSLCPDKMVYRDPTNYVTLCITVINYTRSTNQTKKATNFDLTITHGVEDHIWQANFSKRWFDLEAGDQVKVIVDCGPRVNVKKTGVFLTYDTVFDGNMFPYASTSNKDAIVVIDDGDASIDHVAIEPKSGLGDDQERRRGSHFSRRNRTKYSSHFVPRNERENTHCFPTNERG